MKPQGIPRKIDKLGRICIPAEMCRSLEIAPGDEMDIRREGDHIILTPVRNDLLERFADALYHVINSYTKGYVAVYNREFRIAGSREMPKSVDPRVTAYFTLQYITEDVRLSHWTSCPTNNQVTDNLWAIPIRVNERPIGYVCGNNYDINDYADVVKSCVTTTELLIQSLFS